MYPSFILTLTDPFSGNSAGSRDSGVNKQQKISKGSGNGLPPSLAEVIHLIRSCCDSCPAFITAETRLVSELGFCGEDIEELVLEAEWRFGVKFPSDEEVLRNLFSLKQHEYLFTPQQSLQLSPPRLLLQLWGAPFPAKADICVKNVYHGIITLWLNGGEM